MESLWGVLWQARLIDSQGQAVGFRCKKLVSEKTTGLKYIQGVYQRKKYKKVSRYKQVRIEYINL